MKLSVTFLFLVFLALTPTIACANRLVIISIDGLRPDVALRASAPTFRSLQSQGSFSFYAETTAIAITLPSHMSMITGAEPAVHGITSNERRGSSLRYPRVSTLFEVARKSGLRTALVVGKSKLSSLSPPQFLNAIYAPPKHSTLDMTVAEHVSKIVEQSDPQLLFVHLASVDISGHAHGWGSKEQVTAFEATDAALSVVLKGARFDRLSDYLILTSDHAGSGKGHGANVPLSHQVPFVMVGPRIKQNYDLTLSGAPIRVTDVFQDACVILEIKSCPQRSTVTTAAFVHP